MPVDVAALSLKVDWNAAGFKTLSVTGEIALQLAAAGAIGSLEVGIADALHARILLHDHDLSFHERLVVVFAGDAFRLTSF